MAKHMVRGLAQGFSEGGKRARGEISEGDDIRSAPMSAERDAEWSQGAGEWRGQGRTCQPENLEGKGLRWAGEGRTHTARE